MINQFGFVSEKTFAEKMDAQNAFLSALVTAHNGSLKPSSWPEIQTLVRAGLHKNVFAVGDQLVCQKGNADMVWDIIGIDHDTPSDSQFTHSLTLQLHDCLSFSGSMQVDAPKALYYAENGLSAGTYNFTLPSGYATAYGGGKTYQFTLENAVPEGGQLIFGWADNTQAVNTKIISYSSAISTTPIEEVSVIEGGSGTALGIADGTVTNLCHIERVRHGSNNYGESAIRQYLNSSAAAGYVWTPQTVFDRPPTWANSIAGFMSDLDSDFLAVIGKARKVTALNKVRDGGGSVTLDDKFFFLSRTEIYGGIESDVDEGSPYLYYSDYSDLATAGAEADTNRVKYRGESVTQWWLRSPIELTTHSFRSVNMQGRVSGNKASGAFGIAPACNVI